MATPATRDVLQLIGNLTFGKGGMSVDYLVGAFVKSVVFDNGVWTLTFQDASGAQDTAVLPPGWVVSATEPTSPYIGQGWYDTTSTSLKIYNGTSFAVLVGGTAASLADNAVTTAKIKDAAVTTAKIEDDAITADKLAEDSVSADTIDDAAVTTAKIEDDAITVDKLADDSVATAAIDDGAVTPAKLDAGNANKQDAFLTRLNALRRDLDNIATLSTAKQRTLLLALGSLIEGARPAPSAAYSARTWIDDHDDRAYVCRNRQEVSSAVGGLWSDANTTDVGIEIAENLGDLDDPANPAATDFAYTSDDNKWWQGAVRNSQNVWQETQPTTALSARLTLTPNWTTVWLGRHRWDYNATQQLPHSGLPGMVDYYFYNSRTVTIRKFSLAGYSAAGTVSDHWQWEPLVATAAEIDIIEARDGNLPPLANDGTDDRQIAIANDGIHFVRLIPEAATAAATGSWASYSYSNSSPVRNYIGVVSTGADDPPSATVGDFYYNSTLRRLRIYRPAGNWAWFNDHWEDLSDEDIAWPVRFVGYHRSRAEATAYAASYGITTGQTFVAFTGSEIETGSQFNAGASARFSRHWRFLPLNPPTSTKTLYIDDVFSMPGDVNVEIENGEIGRNWKSVYGVDHTVSISEIKIQVQSESGESTWRIHLLKGVSTAPNSPVEDTIHVSKLLWPLTSEQLTSSAQFSAGTTLTEHTFQVPEVEVNRGEYLVVQLGRVSMVGSKPRVRVVRDLTEHHAFNAFRFVGSGADNRDSGATVNHTVDNVEWTDAGLWIEIGYAIKYDVDAAISTNTDDYLTALAFTVDSGAVKAKATRHEGGEVDATGADLLASSASVTTLAGEVKTSSEIATIADQRAAARYTDAERTKLSGLSDVSDNRIQTLINDTNLSDLQGELDDGQIPTAIMRDSEFTATAINRLLSLTATEVTTLLTGASISNQVLSFTQNDGTVVELTLPAGTGMADGVVASGAFNVDGTTLTLTLDTGTLIVIPVPALPAPTARGAEWGEVAFNAKAAAKLVLTATEFVFTPASTVPTGMAKSTNTVTLPIDPPADEIIGLWVVGSDDGLVESMRRPLLWGVTHRTQQWNSEDIFFASGKIMRVIMTHDGTTGAISLTFQQITGALVGTETIKIYPLITSGTGSRADDIIIADDPVNRVAPVAANENNLLFRNNNLFRQSVHHGRDKSVTWAGLTPATLPNYKGAYDSVSDLPLVTATGDIRFVRRGGHFVKATNTTGNYVDFVPLTFIGSWTRQADATRHATAIGDIAGFIASSGPNQTQMFPNIVTAYTAPESETRLWVRIDVDVLEAVARNYFGFSLGGIVPGVASRRLSLIRPNGVTDIVADLGVQVVYHNTRAEYNLATADGNLHIVTVP